MMGKAFRRFASTVLTMLCCALAACNTAAHLPREATGTDPQPIPTMGGGERLRDGIAEGRFVDASLLEMQQRYAEAILLYRLALASDSNAGPVYFAIAKCFQGLHQDDSALLYARLSVERDSSRIDARRLYAALLLTQGRLPRAVEEYESIARSIPDDIESRYRLAQLWQRIDPDRAIVHLEYIRRNFPDDPSILLNLGEIYLDHRRYDEAIPVFRQLIALQEQGADLYQILGTRLMQAGRYDDVLALIQDIAPRFATDSLARQFFNQQSASALSQLNRAAGGAPLRAFARRLVEIAAADLPGDHDAVMASGLIDLELGNIGAADSLLRLGLNDSLATASEWAAAAHAYLDGEMPAKVTSLLLPLAGRFAEESDVAYMISVSFQETGRWDSAEKFVRRSLASNPENDLAWILLAQIYDRSGRYIASNDAFRHAIRIAPENPEHLNDYAFALAERGASLDTAMVLAERALAAEPDNELFLDTIGWIYYKLGSYEQALRYIRRSVDIGGADAEVIEHLGDVYAALGNPRLAREEFRRALKLRPESATLRAKVRSSR